MDFAYSPRVQALQQQVQRFMDDLILPSHRDWHRWADAGVYPLDVIEPLKCQARDAGLWNLFLPGLRDDEPGTRLANLEYAPLAEIMGRVPWASEVFNCSAPDTGNIELLHLFATPDQRAQWLEPLLEGSIRSCFAMSEPDVASSDPTNLGTRIARDGDAYVLNGRKWFITGAGEASHFILIARTSDDPRHGLTAFLYHKDQPGWRIKRRIPIMGPEEHGGHCEIEFDGLEIPAENVLAGEGKGMKVTQVRLGPARLTHCMRWLGLSKRCIEIAQAYAAERHGFGQRLADRESIQLKLGDLAMRIEIGRLLVMKAA